MSGKELKKIYLDNSATSFPKPPQVADAMCDFIRRNGCNIGRGGYADAYSTAESVLETRELLCEIFNAKNPRNVIFTANVTTALNFLLKGLLKPGDHVLTSAVEHNAVMRPLRQLADQGVHFDRIPCAKDGILDTAAVEDMLNPNTRLVVMTHASNVSGAIQPVEDVAAICRERNIFFIVDAAQTAGCVPLDMEEHGISAVAFTGHKGLLGPQGTGGFIVTDELAALLNPLVSGGTGSYSHLDTMPPRLPDKFEAGTLNLPGIFGLRAALLFLRQTGIARISEHKAALTARFESRLRACPALKIVGPERPEQKTGVTSINFIGKDNAKIALRLEQDYGVLTRCGLHCAPDAHRALGTFPHGTIRFSFGWYNTFDEADFAANAVLGLAGTI